MADETELVRFAKPLVGTVTISDCNGNPLVSLGPGETFAASADGKVTLKRIGSRTVEVGGAARAALSGEAS